MLTGAANGANAPRTVMLSVAEIAKRDGVSKPTVSNHVKRLVEKHGLTVERDGQGRISAVNVAEYDHLRGRFGDPSKAQATRQPEPIEHLRQSESYDEALRQKTWHEAEKRRIELDALKKTLIPVADVERTVEICGSEIVRIIERLPSMTDDLAAVVAREGAHGLRVALKRLSISLREDIARALEAIASGSRIAPDPAPPIEEQPTEIP